MKKVLVFGSFDVVHPGHLYFLQRARSHGDELVVSVARDGFIEATKGKAPWHNENDRLTQVLATGIPDRAILSDEVPGNFSVVRRLRPDLVCFGHDQAQLAAAFADWMNKNGEHINTITLDAYQPERFRSSVLKTVLGGGSPLPKRSSDILSSPEHLEFVAMVGAMCLFFAAVEYLFPKPLPFMRLGIANLPLLLVLDLFPLGTLLLLTAIKVLGQGLINGTLASYVFLFSAVGSFASILAMHALYQAARHHVSLVGISVIGGLASNIVQTALSVGFIFGQQAWIIIPLFLGIGFAGSLVVGILAQEFSNRSAWYRMIRRHYARH